MQFGVLCLEVTFIAEQNCDFKIISKSITIFNSLCAWALYRNVSKTFEFLFYQATSLLLTKVNKKYAFQVIPFSKENNFSTQTGTIWKGNDPVLNYN